MSLLYKDPKDVVIKCEVKREGELILLDFEADCGKFGTWEPVDGYKLTPKRLINILQDRQDYKEEELL